MSVKVIYLAGVPASGKSTIFKCLRKELFPHYQEFKYGNLRGIESKVGQYKMFGVFDDSTFEGTDKLPMNVIESALAYIKILESEEKRYVVYVEGDRLFNRRFISKTGATLLVIDAAKKVLQNRHKLRCDSQNERFLKSRRTKVENYLSNYGGERVFNNTEGDKNKILHFLVRAGRQYINSNE